MVSKQWSPSNSGANLGALSTKTCFVVFFSIDTTCIPSEEEETEEPLEDESVNKPWSLTFFFLIICAQKESNILNNEIMIL